MGAGQVIRVVIDTNVIVSALLFGGKPGRLVTYWKEERIRPYTSAAIVEELLRVLSYPKFDFASKEIEYLLYSEVLPFFEITTVKSGSTIITNDPADDIFLHCAEAAGAEAAISGDRHLLSMKSHRGIPILTPGQFLNRFF